MQKRFKSIKAFILDLDDTLYNCSDTLLLRGRKKVAKTISGLIGCSEEEAYRLQVEMDEKYGTKENIYEKIVILYNLPDKYSKKLLEEFIRIEITDISLFPDVINTLTNLKSRCYKLFLVTSGEKQIQWKKIDVLGLNNNYFNEILITDRNAGYTKKVCFNEIMQRHNLKPSENACVGDKIEDELTAGKSLGMFTVMFEHGRHYQAYLKGQEKYIKPDYSIKHIGDILRHLNNT